MTTFATSNRSSERFAIGMLLVACAFWGMSFNWNKEAQSILSKHWVEAGDHSPLGSHGPATFLAVRFPLAALAWALLFPRSLRGWNKITLRGGVAGGMFLSVGMLLQHYGLSYTSESLSAFLTSLTIIFTPIAAALVLKHRISPALWCAIGLATLGVALMTLYREEGRFEIGALLGLFCAVVFSGHLLVVDYFGKRDDPWRFTLAQLVVAGIVFLSYALWRFGGDTKLAPRVVMGAFGSWKFAALTAAAVFLATLVTFGLMFRFQPRTTPTRAALVYLTEPLFATAYAWLAADRIIGVGAWLGAGLIIVGNVVAEIFPRRDSVSDIAVARPATSFDT
jgi:drug/metabolite transporter (DMT)-like permease